MSTEIRTKGSTSLQTVLKQQQNIKTIEKAIHKCSKKLATQDDSYDSIYNKILYQTIGDIINGIDLPILIQNIKNNNVCWKHPCFNNIENRINEQDDFILNPFEVEEGVTECNKCGSKRVFTYSSQVRSCDEPMTTFAKCVKCASKWTYSG